MAFLTLEPLPPHSTKGELLRFVCEAGGIDGKEVGRIDLSRAVAVVEVPDHRAARLVKALDGAKLRNRPLRASLSRTPPALPGDEDHFQRLARLLDLEAEAEREQAAARIAAGGAESDGYALTALVVRQEDSGLGGRLLLTLGKKDPNRPLPPTRLQSGAPLLLTHEGSSPTLSWRAVLAERTERAVQVAIDAPEDSLPDEGTWRIDLASDEVSRQRQQAALERARTAHRDRLAELRQVLLAEREPGFAEGGDFTPLDTGLNASQREAVRFALGGLDFAAIHGPPGTGKTTAVVELIRQAVRDGEKVLACAPSNLAVDNLLEKLLAAGEKPVRLGHPARVLPELRARALDLLVEDHPDARLARKFTKKAHALFRQAGKWTRAKPDPGAKQAMRKEARELLAEARRLEAQAVDRVLDGARIVCATLTGIDSNTLGAREFDRVVLDEACQSTEPASWIPLLRAKRVVLAGDHCQLPPTVVSPEAAAAGLSVSLMERLVGRFGPSVSRRLRVQYRMNEAIAGFSSEEFYESDLLADPSVGGHLLRDLPGVADVPLTETPVQFIDTAGASYDEEPEPEGESRRNPQEAALAARKVRELLEAGVPAEAIAVIAPYSAQVRLLRELLPVPGLEIDSVDGFQGREKEAVVFSLVRSNAEGEIGFLADVRRTNVALTRARRKLVVVGDSATLSAHPFYQRLFAYFERIEAYGSVWEEGV